MAHAPLDGATLSHLGILLDDDTPPFDIIGDVHGCIDELRSLFYRLGYLPKGAGYWHPDGRRAIFVGDLVDRGPGNVPVLQLALAMRDAGRALAVLGNHDRKLLRWLRSEPVRMVYGLALTVDELLSMPDDEREALRARLITFFERTPGYLILDGGHLIVTHGALRDDMIGCWDDTIARYCLYGEVEGIGPQGRPLRRDWGGARAQRFTLDGNSPYIVYGHNAVHTARWVNRTLDLDTSCVYGGMLSALRWPERELIQVVAQRAYFMR
jgi:protein phosphatase